MSFPASDPPSYSQPTVGDPEEEPEQDPAHDDRPPETTQRDGPGRAAG